MNYLVRPYLCGPINGCTDEECSNWRKAMTEIFPLSIDPMRRDYRGKEIECAREIVSGDKADILRSTHLVLNYWKPSVGASMEVLFAWENRVPVIVWCRKETTLSPWLIYHSDRVVHRLDDVALSLQEGDL